MLRICKSNPIRRTFNRDDHEMPDLWTLYCNIRSSFCIFIKVLRQRLCASVIRLSISWVESIFDDEGVVISSLLRSTRVDWLVNDSSERFLLISCSTTLFPVFTEMLCMTLACVGRFTVNAFRFSVFSRPVWTQPHFLELLKWNQMVFLLPSSWRRDIAASSLLSSWFSSSLSVF